MLESWDRGKVDGAEDGALLPSAWQLIMALRMLTQDQVYWYLLYLSRARHRHARTRHQPFYSLWLFVRNHVVPTDRGYACRKVGTGDEDYLPPSPSSGLVLVQHIFQHISCCNNRHEATGGGGGDNRTIASSSAAAGTTCGGGGGVSFLILGRL